MKVFICDEDADPAREWGHLLRTIAFDCRRVGWTDMDAYIAWKIGVQALLEARRHGARFDHDPDEEDSA